MRIGINLTWLVPDVVGGSEEATTRALHAVADLGPTDADIVLFGLAALRDAHADLVDRFETHTLALPGRIKPLRVAAEHTWLAGMTRLRGIDVLHDAGGTAPGHIEVPRVLTIHDIQPLERPENFGRVRVAYLRFAVPAAVSAAARIMVPSEFVRTSLVDTLGADGHRIDVVPWTPPRRQEPTPIDAVRARYGILGRILVVPGVTYPHKDQVTAVRAMGHLAARHPEVTMVIAGGTGPSEQAVRDEIAASAAKARIVRTGRLREPDLAALVDHADAVIIPSRYEGFGIPALEAMTAGVPIVVADAGSLPEVVGAGGVVFPAGDDEQLAVELHRLLSDSDHRRSQGAASRERARAFSPERTATAMMAAYRSAATDL